VTLSIDYDNTWTQDPDFWAKVAELGRALGHRVIICSQRPEPPHPAGAEVIQACRDYVDAVILCSGESKRKATSLRGFAVDVWVDDFPIAVEEGMVFNNINWRRLQVQGALEEMKEG